MTAIVRLTAADEAPLTAMRQALWPDENAAELAGETLPMLSREDYAVFGALENSRLVGFVEVGQRDVGEGCSTSPVGYIEGLWVAPEARRKGTARALMNAATAWARERGFSELCSDTQLWNVASQEMHQRLGFDGDGAAGDVPDG